MNYFAITALINFLTSSLVGIFVLLKNPKSSKNRGLFYYALGVGSWSFSYFLWQLADDELSALFWCKSLMFSAIFIPTAMFHLSIAIIEKFNQYKNQVYTAYFISFVFGILDIFTSFIVSDVQPRAGFAYWPSPGILFVPFLIFFFGAVIYSHILMYKCYVELSGIERNKIKYIFLGTAIAFSGGSTNYFLWFDIPILPYGNIFVSVYVLLVAYAIIKYRLMDIRLAITRAGIFLFVYTLVLGIPFGLAGIGRNWLVNVLGPNGYWVPMVLLLILATAGPFIYSFIQNKAEEKILENEKRIQDLLSKVSFGMTTIKEINRLLALIVDVIRKTLGINHVDIYLKDNNQYLLKASNNGHLPSLSFTPDNPLIVHLQRDYNVLVYEELQQAQIPGKDDVLKKLDSLSAKIVVPFTLQNNLLGFLVLGQRNNKEVYSQYIINALRVMGDQIALAIENCQFLAAEKEMLKKEGARARRESLDMLVSTMAHEIDNPITSVIGHADIISEYIENNKTKIPEEDYSEIIKSANYVMKDAARVSKIIKAVEDYSKGGEGKLKEISFYDALDPFHTLLTLVRKKVSGVNYMETIEPNLPSIMAEQILIEEILLNFSENAFHAVRENTNAKNVTLKVFNESNSLRIEMIDNGYGIPQNILKQIFEVPTTTKGSSEGTGIGLYRVRQICNVLKAKYGAESKGPGQGALLYVEIPFAVKNAS